MTDKRAAALLDTATKQAILEGHAKDPATWSHVSGSVEWDDGLVQRFGRPDVIDAFQGDLYLRWKIKRKTKGVINFVSVMGFRSHVFMPYNPDDPKQGDMWVDQRIALS